MVVGDGLPGVRVAGVLLQAGQAPSGGAAPPSVALLQWGTQRTDGDALWPGFLHDVFARVGGPDSEEVSPLRSKGGGGGGGGERPEAGGWWQWHSYSCCCQCVSMCG